MLCPDCKGELRPLVDRADGSTACANGRCAFRCVSCGAATIARDPVAVARRDRRIRVITLTVTVLGVFTDLVWNGLLPWMFRNQNPDIQRLATHGAVGCCAVAVVYLCMRAVLEAMSAPSFKERNEHAATAIFFFLVLCVVGYLIIEGAAQGKL